MKKSSTYCHSSIVFNYLWNVMDLKECLIYWQLSFIKKYIFIKLCLNWNKTYNFYVSCAIYLKYNKLLLYLLLLLFLAHLSTKSSSELLWSFNVRRPSVCACVRASTISLNNISSETAYWILTKLHRNDPRVVLYQSCSNRSSWLHK